ncbi:uncharacterized protein LOC133737618 [Rosa rugosa]|uniref:uncharacterized protein LOC133737618 n=1 Tax=Rosa rugosa TaxID=74645 RepID=UPI002B40EA46|nr:uncharacterized protein LOC133737618 [Rosa rugosa]
MAKQEDAPLLPQLVRNDSLLINGLLPIILGFYKVTEIRSRVNNDAYLHGPETLLATRSMSVFSSSIKLLSERPYYTKLIADHLSGMGVPQRVRPYIIQEIFRAVDVAVPDIVIDVTIGDRTTLIYGDYARTIEDRVISESLEGYKAKLIPATKSSIDGLEKVRVDSFQGEEEGSRPKKRSRQSCVICLDPLDAATASCAEEEGRDKTINRLPCSHLYHGDCIVKWLNINHVRPMCRYPMPTVEEAKPLQ